MEKNYTVNTYMHNTLTFGPFALSHINPLYAPVSPSYFL